MASKKCAFLKSGQSTEVKWNSAYANCHNMKLLMRCSPEVRIMSSGSGRSAVCNYLSMVDGSTSSGASPSFIMVRIASTISHLAL